jgi:exosome complex component RRP40
MIVVLPGDDLTAHIHHHGAHDHGKLTNNKNTTGATTTSSQHDGDDSTRNNKNKQQQQQRHPIKLGTGLIFNLKLNTITATMAGRLMHNPSTNAFFIVANTKRYIPQLNDRVIAIVEDRMGDYYRVTVPHTSHGSAILHITAFTGATKRNRPNLKRGDLIYGRICTGPSQHEHMEPEITCTVMPGEQQQSGGGAAIKDWMTDEATYGQLKGGTCVSISIGLARELLNPNNVVLEALGSCGIPFEICIGVNGVLWVNAPRPEYTILVLNAVQNSEVLTEYQVRGMVKRLVETVKRSNPVVQYDGNVDDDDEQEDEEEDHEEEE